MRAKRKQINDRSTDRFDRFRVVCQCQARACTVVLRALSVCGVVHVVVLRAWGSAASESLGRGRKNAAPQP